MRNSFPIPVSFFMNTHPRQLDMNLFQKIKSGRWWPVAQATGLLLLLLAQLSHGAGKPNIVLIVADDLGYRDIGCYGATNIATPKIDRLATQGARFTDAHSVGAVCNPSRYSILAGTYLWHSKRKNDYSLYFHEGQVTLPALLKSGGYNTVALGKWHNGFGRDLAEPDWNGELKPGPLEIGFDYFFGTPRSHNEPPLVFVENHRVVGLDPADPIQIDRSKGPHGIMTGGKAAMAARPDDRIDLILADKAVEYFSKQSAEVPFFMYLAFEAPHVPLTPAPEFSGKSRAGRYGDFIEQLDHCVGQVIEGLKKQGLEQNTLVILTSDNGGVYDQAALKAGHRCNGELLGQKTDVWEGGHRVPLVATWPGKIPQGVVRKELFTQVDLMATLAEAAGIPLPAGASQDGASELAAFTDPLHAPAKRTEAVFLGTGGFALRQGDWIYIPQQGSGGMTVPELKPRPWSLSYQTMGFINADLDDQGQSKSDAPPNQLYSLADDLAQHTNVVLQYPERQMQMQTRAEELLPQRYKKSTAAPAVEDKSKLKSP